MDYRRLSTQDVLVLGVTALPAPETDVPQDREVLEVEASDNIAFDSLIAALNNNCVIKCCEYYGIAYAWLGEMTYRGILLQYRSIAEDKKFHTAEQCAGWFVDLLPAISG